jgi:hypothetical protein
VKRFWEAEVKFDHGVGEGFCVSPEIRYDLEESAIVGSVDLFEGDLSRIIDHDQRGVTEETVTERNTTRIRWRVASTDELYPLKFDPCHVGGTPVSTCFDKLTNEGNDPLGAVLVHSWKVDFVTKHDQPTANLHGSEDDSIGSLAVLAVLLECLEDQLGGCSTGEVETNDFHVWKFPEGTEQSHGLS